MEQLSFDILDIIIHKVVTVNHCLYYGLICSCKTFHEYGLHRKKALDDFKIIDIIDIVHQDNIETMALYIYKNKDINDCIKLSLLNGSLNTSWWLWNQHRPYLTIQILMDVERRMLLNKVFDCNELIYRIIKSIQCAYEAASKMSVL
jgi:hypothetical protein